MAAQGNNVGITFTGNTTDIDEKMAAILETIKKIRQEAGGIPFGGSGGGGGTGGGTGGGGGTASGVTQASVTPTSPSPMTPGRTSTRATGPPVQHQSGMDLRQTSRTTEGMASFTRKDGRTQYQGADGRFQSMSLDQKSVVTTPTDPSLGIHRPEGTTAAERWSAAGIRNSATSGGSRMNFASAADMKYFPETKEGFITYRNQLHDVGQEKDAFRAEAMGMKGDLFDPIARARYMADRSVSSASAGATRDRLDFNYAVDTQGYEGSPNSYMSGGKHHLADQKRRSRDADRSQSQIDFAESQAEKVMERFQKSQEKEREKAANLFDNEDARRNALDDARLPYKIGEHSSILGPSSAIPFRHHPQHLDAVRQQKRAAGMMGKYAAAQSDPFGFGGIDMMAGVGSPLGRYSSPMVSSFLSSPYGKASLVVGANIGGQVIGGAMNSYANSIANGENDPAGMANLYGQGIGAIAGGLLGAAIAGPQGVVTGATGPAVMGGMFAGQSIGGAAATLVMAPYMRDRNAALAMIPIARAMGEDPYQMLGLNSGNSLDPSKINEKLKQAVHDIGYGDKNAIQKLMVASGLYTGTDILSLPKMANVSAAYGSALFGAGLDDRDLPTSGGALAKSTAKRYGLASEQIAGMVAPMFANRRKYEVEIGEDRPDGGAYLGTTRERGAMQKITSHTDQILAFGAEAYQHYANITGAPKLGDKEKRSLAEYQLSETETERASLRIRGAGAGVRESTSRGMDALEGLPNGQHSTAHMRLRRHNIAAQFQEFGEEDTVSYGIPMARLQGQLDRSHLLPYSPGYSFGMELTGIKARSQYHDVLSKRFSTLKSRGDLSEQDELGMVHQMEGLQTANAQGIANLSEGFENRLPAMSAGRSRFFGRFNSLDGAAMNLAGLGHPSRAFGAMNGRQLQNQDDFVKAFALPANASVGVGSTTSAMNNPQVVGLLERIARALEGKNSGGSRPGEARGKASGSIERADVGTKAAYSQTK